MTDTTEWKPDICIYHANCYDGLGAAWAVWSRWPEIEFVPANYGDDAPDIFDKNVLIVDFSYKRDVLEEMSAAASSIIILDHHKSAEAELAGLNHIVGGSPEVVELIMSRATGPLANVLTWFDLEHSGAVLAWKFCFPGERVPPLLGYIEDRDLWRFKLHDSRAVNAVISTIPFTIYDLDHQNGKYFDRREVLDDTIDIGRAICTKQSKDIDVALGASTRMATIAGHRVPMANVPFAWASEAGNILAEGNPFSATYFDTATERRFSLRSSPDGFDVSEIAKLYGGGGHKHAAGFSRPHGWEGE